MQIRPVADDDIDTWLILRCALWPDHDIDAHREDLDRILSNKLRSTALLCVDEQDDIVGFAEVSSRAQVDGCRSTPVGCLEALFVKPNARRQGNATALIEAAEQWARSRGCREFASDTPIDDQAARTLHAAFGFDEVRRVIRFKKTIPPRAEPTPSQQDGARRAPLDALQATKSASSAVGPESGWRIAHVVVGVLALLFIWLTDISSPDVMKGALYPVLAFLSLLYLAALFVVSRYRSRTNEGERGGQLMTGKFDQTDT